MEHNKFNLNKLNFAEYWISAVYKLLCKRYSNPHTDLDRPRGFQEVEAPRSGDNRHMKAVRLSALRTISVRE